MKKKDKQRNAPAGVRHELPLRGLRDHCGRALLLTASYELFSLCTPPVLPPKMAGDPSSKSARSPVGTNLPSLFTLGAYAQVPPVSECRCAGGCQNCTGCTGISVQRPRPSRPPKPPKPLAEADQTYNSANAMLRSQNYQQAADLYRHALQLKPRFAPSHYNLAIALANLGNQSEAIREAENALRYGLKGQYRAECQEWLQRMRAAVQEQAERLRREAERRQRVALATQAFDEGRRLYGLGRYAEAEAAYRKAFAYDPDSNTANNLGMALYMGNHVREAEEFYRKAISMDPKHVNAHKNLGSLLLDQKRYAEAEGVLRRAVQLSGDAASQGDLGTALLQQGRLQEAEAALREALRIDPGFRSAQTQLDDLLARQAAQRPAGYVAVASGVPADAAELTPRVSIRSAAQAVQHAIDQAFSNADSTARGYGSQNPEQMAAGSQLVIDTLGNPVPANIDVAAERHIRTERAGEALAARIPKDALENNQAIQTSVAWFARLEADKLETRARLAGVQKELDNHQGDTQVLAVKQQQLSRQLEQIARDQQTAVKAIDETLVHLGKTWVEEPAAPIDKGEPR